MFRITTCFTTDLGCVYPSLYQLLKSLNVSILFALYVLYPKHTYYVNKLRTYF